MNKNFGFPSDQEVEVIAQKFIYNNPRISKEKAQEMARIELSGVIPETFIKNDSRVVSVPKNAIQRCDRLMVKSLGVESSNPGSTPGRAI